VSGGVLNAKQECVLVANIMNTCCKPEFSLHVISQKNCSLVIENMLFCIVFKINKFELKTFDYLNTANCNAAYKQLIWGVDFIPVFYAVYFGTHNERIAKISPLYQNKNWM